MPRSEYTDITLVLDRSGSMSSMKGATIESFNGFLNSQRNGEGFATLSLIQFDNQYDVVYSGLPIAEAPELTDRTFQPRGSTALLDAIGRTIDETGQRYAALPEAQRPGTVIFVILTDGMENASVQYALERVNQKIAHQRDKYSWQFLFLAANQDAIATAATFGISAPQSLTFACSTNGAIGTFAALNRQMHKLRTARAEGNASVDFAFDDTDRADAIAPETNPVPNPRKKGRKV